MISRQETNQLKGFAVLSMLCLHLFCTLTPEFKPLIYVTDVPLVYFIGQAADFCVMAYCFCSGYALMARYESVDNGMAYIKERLRSLWKFLTNYWIILFLFVIVAITMGKATEWLVSPVTFLGNLVTFGYSYNGAWWFVSTYIVMVLLSPLVFKGVKKHPIAVAFAGVLIYILSYRIRFGWGGNSFVVQHLARLGMSYAELLIGTYFYQYKLMDKIENLWKKIVLKKIQGILLFLIVLAIIVIRRYVATLFVAPVSGLIFMVAYLLKERNRGNSSSIFSYLGRHSTNIWLIHMFFYMPQYGGLVYIAKYPLLVLAFLLFICIIASKFVQTIQSRIERMFKKVVLR